MRKWMKMLLLAGVFTVLLCGSALAAGEKGIVGLNGTGVDLTAQTAGGGPVTGVQNSDAGGDFYPDAERVAMTYSGAASGEECLVFVLNDGSGRPTEQNIVYINQETAGANGVTFDLYPSSLASGTTYYIYVSTASAPMTQVGTFGYYAAYTLGDVDSDGKIVASDALFALQISVGKGNWTDTQRLAADVDGKNGVTSTDSLLILQKSVGKPAF